MEQIAEFLQKFLNDNRITKSGFSISEILITSTRLITSQSDSVLNDPTFVIRLELKNDTPSFSKYFVICMPLGEYKISTEDKDSFKVMKGGYNYEVIDSNQEASFVSSNEVINGLINY